MNRSDEMHDRNLKLTYISSERFISFMNRSDEM